MKLLSKIVLTIITTVLVGVIGFFIYAYKNRNPSSLKLCGWGATYPYYAATDYYKNDFYDFKEYIHTNYDSLNNTLAKNGIVRVRFLINCRGEIGNFKTQAYDLEYKVVSLSEKFTGQFERLINDYKRWDSPKSNNGESINIHKFYTFKFKGGKLIEIMPK